MMMKRNVNQKGITWLIIAALLVFRIFIGIQTNFSHEDYHQIYLMGLENAYSGDWSYWGPDVVWSETRLPGALQGVLIGVPLKIFNHAYAPIVLSNLIAGLGLILIAFYTKRRFPKFSLNFLLILLLLLPAYLRDGTVLLNTAYLIFSGALLFISVFELFVYRDNLLFKNRSTYFLMLGFALLFTYQLHLSWVMFLPYVLVLIFMEWQHDKRTLLKNLVYFSIGAVLPALLLFPTLIQFGDSIYSNASGNTTFNGSRLLQVFDFILRYFSFVSFDIIHTADPYVLSAEKSVIVKSMIWIVKVLGILQIAAIVISLFKVKKTNEFKRLILLFGLTVIMSVVLYSLSRKHLSARTYILIYPIPLWMSFYAYDYLKKYPIFKPAMVSVIAMVFITFVGIGKTNYHNSYSFHNVKEKLDKAMNNQDPSEFGERRKTLMDDLK